jgi:excisionase family DNA binding protein
MPNHSARLGEKQAQSEIRRTAVGQLWDVKQAAHVIGCSENTVRNMIRRGDLEAVRVGPRLIRLRAADVESALQPIEPALAGTWAGVR